MNVKILVCCHKQDVMATSAPYMPVQVGKAVSKVNLGVIGDDTGDNISSKNKSYCECTGLYWAWKNLKGVDIIGLCHYRRYFDFHHQVKRPYNYRIYPASEFGKLDLSVPESVIRKVAKGGVVVTEPNVYPYSIWCDYCNCHYSTDLRVVHEIICEKGEEKYIDAFDESICKNNKLLHYNMFLMRWEDFDRYCTWLFSILEAAEHRIDISHYDAVQGRIWGYLAERLMNVWLYAEQKELIKRPMLWILNEKVDRISPLHYMFKCWKYNLAMKLVNPLFSKR